MDTIPPQPEASAPKSRLRSTYSVPRLDCDCWRLTWPLTGEKPPDHVCDQTAAATIYNGPPIPEAELTPELGWPVYFRQSDWWGQPGRRLALVIREWAQEAPKRTLANLLRDSWEWPQVTSWIYGDFVRWRRRHPGAPISDWIEDPSDNRRYAALLWQQRLPGTANTLRFLRGCAAYQAYRRPTSKGGRTFQVTDDGGTEEVFLPEPGEEEARFQAAFDTVLAQHPDVLPSRGALVTTLVFALTGPIKEFGVRYDPDPWFRTEGPAEFATRETIEAVGRVVRKHRDWLRERFGCHPLAETSAIHQAKPGAFRKMDASQAPIDYVQEAVSRAPNLLIEHPNWQELPDWSKADKVDRLLDKARDAVRQNRRRHRLPTRVPRGWRKTAQGEILRQIDFIIAQK